MRRPDARQRRDLARLAGVVSSPYHEQVRERAAARLGTAAWDVERPWATWQLLRCWCTSAAAAGALTQDLLAARRWLDVQGWRQRLRLLHLVPPCTTINRSDRRRLPLLDLLVESGLRALAMAVGAVSQPAWERLCVQVGGHDRPVPTPHRGRTSQRIWSGMAALLDAVTTVDGRSRVHAVIEILVRRLYAHLGAQIEHVGLRPITSEELRVDLLASGVQLQLADLQPMELRWDGRGWTHLSEGYRTLTGQIATPRLAHALAQAWITAGGYIPSELLATPSRLPTEARCLIATGLPNHGMFGEDIVDATAWWNGTIGLRVATACAVVERRSADHRTQAVHARLAALSPLPERADLGLLDQDAFWQHPHAVADVLRLDYVAIVLHALVANPDPGRLATWWRSGWSAACSHPHPPSRILRRTLGRLRCAYWAPPRDITIIDLGSVPLVRSLGPLGVQVALRLVALARRRETHPAERLWLAADEEAIRGALTTWQVACAPHTTLVACIDDCLDYRQEASSLMFFATRSATWHQAMPERRRRQPAPLAEIMPDPATPLAPLPQPLPQIPGVDIMALMTVADLIAEGERMCHCVGSPLYAQRGIAGRSWFVHLEHAGAAATVEIHDDLSVAQARGPRNMRNAATVWAEVHLTEALYNRLVGSWPVTP